MSTPSSTGPARSTRQRTAVARAIGEQTGFVSAQQLHDELRHRGDSVGLTTVYRTLQSMAEAGEVDLLVTDDGETVYRRCSPDHHHHLVCRDCGRTIEIAGPAVEKWAATVAREHGFTDIRHTLEVFGRCGECSSAGR